MARLAETSTSLSTAFTRFVESCRVLEEMRPTVEQVYRQEMEQHAEGDDLPEEIRAEYRHEMASIRDLLGLDLARFIPDGWAKPARGRRAK